MLRKGMFKLGGTPDSYRDCPAPGKNLCVNTCLLYLYFSKFYNMANSSEPKVTGIGGIFFFSEDPKAIKEWYSKNLGLEVNAWGSVSFETRNVLDQMIPLQWNPFKKSSDHFSPSKKEFMINYTVQNLEGLVKKLRDNGVTIVDDIATYDFGKFVHIMDSEGTKIELWEPV
jgi:predicted enzyme related to lactoylglutathione lyase